MMPTYRVNTLKAAAIATKPDLRARLSGARSVITKAEACNAPLTAKVTIRESFKRLHRPSKNRITVAAASAPKCRA